MDANNFRLPQVDNGMDPNSNWRNDLSGESRQKIVNKIMDTLQRHMPPTGSDSMSELKKIALRFEEKIYSAAANQQDYLRKISLKMLSLETKAHGTAANPLPPTMAGGGNPKNLDPSAVIMQQPQIRNPAQALANGLQINAQAQARQQLLSQNFSTSIPGAGMQSSTGLVTGLSQTPISNVGGQSSGLSIMTGISQGPMNNSPGQLSQNALIASAQRQLQSRQQQHQQQVVQQQHQQQSQAQQQQQQQQLLYQQQLQQQAFLKQKLQQQSHLQPSILQQQQHLQQQSHLQQQQPVLQQSHLQASQQSVLQSAQQPVLQPSQQSILQQASSSVLQPSQQSALQQTQPTNVQQASQSVLQQHSQFVHRQQQSQQSAIQQQPSILQQQQSSMVQQSIIQPQQQQQQLLGQQNNVSNMQQQQHQHQLQQPFQSKAAQHQQTQQQPSSLLQSQAQQSQQQTQQQLLSQLQPQQQQLQQQPLLQQSNSMQQELQQRLQTSNGLLQQQQQSSIEQQKQLLQAQQRGMSEASSTSMDSSGQTGQSTVVDWQEKVYQRLQSLKDMYLHEIKELFTRLSLKCEQPMAADQTEKLKHYKGTLHRMMQYFHVQKSSIPPGFKEDKVDAFEKQILTILNSFKQRKAIPQQQGQQLQPQTGSQVPTMQQQPQPQISQMQQQEKHVNQLQQMNLQASATSMQSSNVTSMQHGSMPLLQQTSVQTSQQNIRSMMQPGANLNPTQGTGVGALQQSSVNTLQQNNNVNPLQPNNLSLQQNNISSLQQSGIHVLQQNNLNPLQSNANALQQQQQQQALKLQQQQLHQRHMHQQLLQQQQQQQQQHLQQQQLQHQIQQQQQLHQQQKQQQAQLQAQLHAQQIPQLQQMNDLSNDSKAKQAAVVKQAFMQQQHQLSQRSVYQQQQQQQQQLKPGPSLSVSSPQLLPAASPQVSQQSSPQIDQTNLVASSLQAPKVGTPMQPASSPFMAPSPSTLPAPSPLIDDAEKQSSAISSISNAGSGQGLQQTATALSHPQSIAIGTPGISASPLLADFSPSPAQNLVSQDGHQTVSPGFLMADKSSTAEPPLERLIKILNSMSPKALDSAVSDLGSVVSLIDRMAGSAPGNGSRAAVGEDLVAMTKCRLQARNLMSQDGNAATKKMRRRMSSMPLSAVSSGGSVTNSLQQHSNLESPEMESTATSKIKRPRHEMSHAVQDEIREINQQLIDTVVEVSEDDNDAAAAAAEGREGIVVKFSYNAIALSPNMKSRYKSTQMLLISPLRLLIPVDYPNCSPVILDKVPAEPCREHEDLSSKAKVKFNASVRNLQQPMSIKAMAKTWEDSARNVVAEYAHQSGGGSFSSRFGTWENCASA